MPYELRVDEICNPENIYPVLIYTGRSGRGQKKTKTLHARVPELVLAKC